MPDLASTASRVAGCRRPYLLVISQVYVPDPAAVGQYIADAAEEMVRRGWDVRVFAASRGYDDPSTRYRVRESRNGVAVRRLPFSSFGKRSIAVRLLAQSMFLAQAFVRGMFGRRPDLVLVSTSPPFAGFVGAILGICRRVPFAWWAMDINPDQLVAAGKLTPGALVVRIFDWMNRVTLRRAAGIVALDRHMARRLEAKLPVIKPIAVIPPWPLLEQLDGRTAETGGFRGRHGVQGKFVIMYAGNHAMQHPLDTLLDAAGALEPDPRLVFMFIGGGAGKAAVERRIVAGAKNVRSLPPVPLDQLADVLSSADVHVVTMGDDMVGIVHPSKIYSALAVGRPILFLGPAQSHVGELVAQHRVGWGVRHGDVAGAMAAIRAAVAADHDELRAMGERAVQAVSQSLSCGRLRGEFCDLLARAASGNQSATVSGVAAG